MTPAEKWMNAQKRLQIEEQAFADVQEGYLAGRISADRLESARSHLLAVRKASDAALTRALCARPRESARRGPPR